MIDPRLTCPAAYRLASLGARTIPHAGLGLLLAAAIGCERGPGLVPVSGHVLIDGQPLQQGSIQFVHPSTRPAGGRIAKDGRFELSYLKAGDGALVGHYKVKVTAVEPVGTDQQRWLAPKKYADENTSGIEVDITGPKQDLAINLTWGGGKPFVERQ